MKKPISPIMPKPPKKEIIRYINLKDYKIVDELLQALENHPKDAVVRSSWADTLQIKSVNSDYELQLEKYNQDFAQYKIDHQLWEEQSCEYGIWKEQQRLKELREAKCQSQ